MSTKLSFREALERRVPTKAGPPAPSVSPNASFVLRAGAMPQPVDVARLLMKHGMSLTKAHQTLNRLAEGKTVAVELYSDNDARLIAAFAKLGVEAKPIRAPSVDVKRVRERFGLSQAEFAIRFGFEIDTVQNWEQGRNVPDQPTQLLLKVIETYPEDVEKVLTGKS